MALTRHHLNSSWGHCLAVNGCGFNPAQLLCMQPITEQTMSMIRYFSSHNPVAFTMSAKYIERWDDPDFSFSALHAVCRYGQPNCEILQHLLQLDGGQVLTKKSSPLGETPLEYLFRNEAYRKEVLLCLLEVNSSYAMIGSGLSYLLAFECSLQWSLYDHSSCLLEIIECLLSANPAGIFHRSSFSACPLIPKHPYNPTVPPPPTHYQQLPNTAPRWTLSFLPVPTFCTLLPVMLGCHPLYVSKYCNKFCIFIRRP